MSFVDLATLTMHRRNELEGRINLLTKSCDQAINDIKKLNARAKGLVLQLNCEPEDLKEKFLNSMKQLDEYMYLITDFNLALGKIEDTGSTESTPVHDNHVMVPLPAPMLNHPLNLIDALSEPTPSTSTACFNHCPPAKPKRFKVPKEEQLLIAFSTPSTSSESVPQVNTSKATKEVQCEIVTEMKDLKLEVSKPVEQFNLPAQTVLEMDHVYPATIMHVDGIYFWVITDNSQDVIGTMSDMTKYYTDNHVKLSPEDVKPLNCCSFFDADSECYYRGLFLRLLEGSQENINTAEVFVVDTGEIRTAPVECVQPLAEQFCHRPPFARCCYLAGVDLSTFNNQTLMQKQEEFLRRYIGSICTIKVDDNSSEALGVYVILPSKEILNDIFVQQGLGVASKSCIFKNLSENQGNCQNSVCSSETLVHKNDMEISVKDSSMYVSENGMHESGEGGGDVQENNDDTVALHDDDGKLFVGGMSFDTTYQDLHSHFSAYGDIESINIKTGKVLRFAFIVYKSPESVDKVMAAGEHIVHNKKVNPQRAKARQLRVFVGGLADEISDDEIKKFFSNFGTVVAVVKPVDKQRNPRKGFCFITFKTEREVNELLKTPNLIIAGKEIEVKRMISMPGPSGTVENIDNSIYGFNQCSYDIGQFGFIYGKGGYNQAGHGYGQSGHGYGQSYYGGYYYSANPYQ